MILYINDTLQAQGPHTKLHILNLNKWQKSLVFKLIKMNRMNYFFLFFFFYDS